MSDTPTFGRYAEIPVDRMTPQQREGYRFLVEGPRGRLPGPYKIWVHNPKLLHAAAPLGQHFTPGQSSLSEREHEIAVVVITGRWHSAYPQPRAKSAARRSACPRPRWKPSSPACPRRFRTRGSRRSTRWRWRSPRAGWCRRACMTEVLGHESITDVVVLMGYYTAVCLTMNFYAVPAGAPGLAR